MYLNQGTSYLNLFRCRPTHVCIYADSYSSSCSSNKLLSDSISTSLDVTLNSFSCCSGNLFLSARLQLLETRCCFSLFFAPDSLASTTCIGSFLLTND